MDPQRFDDALLDELYDELDGETSAAMKEWAASHPEAAAKLANLRAASEAARSIEVDPAADLESRILARARAARRDSGGLVDEHGNRLSSSQRVARIISRAGGWAMKPQTAMAALFLLMIGSSVLLVRGRRTSEPTAANVQVTEQGTPAEEEGANGESAEAPDPKAAALAHGAEQKRKAPPPQISAEPAPADDQDKAVADLNAPAPTNFPLTAPGEARGRADTAGPFLLGGSGSAPGGGAAGGGLTGIGGDVGKKGAAYAQRDEKEEPRASAPMAPVAQAAAPAAAPPPPMAASKAESSGMLAANEVAATENAAPRAAAKPSAKAASSEMDLAMAAYTAKDYVGARARFDRLAANGDPVAALWAARSVREGTGCSAAVPRFDAIVNRASGTPAGNDAALEGARCLRLLGQVEAARTRLRPLLSVDSHADRARAEMDLLNGSAPAKAAPKR